MMNNIPGRLMCNLRRLVLTLCLLLLVVLGLLFVFGDPRYGILESQFRLSKYSRLPAWVTLPQGYSRSDLEITISLYDPILSANDRVVLTVYGPPPEKKVLIEKVGTERWHPFTAKQLEERDPSDAKPEYIIVTIDGIDEVLKGRGYDDFLYVTDDPKLRSYTKKEK